MFLSLIIVEKYEFMNSSFIHKCKFFWVECPKYTDFWQKKKIFFHNYQNQGQSTEEKEIKEEGE